VSVGAAHAQRLLVDHDLGMIAIDHRGDGQLRLIGRADLAHHQQVQRRVQRARHLGRHRHATARQCQHDGIGQLQRGHTVREQPPGLDTIDKSVHATQCVQCAAQFHALHQAQRTKSIVR